jgi:hypothetical protein
MADHFSGPRAIARPARDITDLYVFKSPEQSAHLVLVMDVCPSAFFSDAITCCFLLRPISIAAIERASAFDIWLRPKRQQASAYKQHLGQ